MLYISMSPGSSLKHTRCLSMILDVYCNWVDEVRKKVRCVLGRSRGNEKSKTRGRASREKVQKVATGSYGLVEEGVETIRRGIDLILRAESQAQADPEIADKLVYIGGLAEQVRRLSARQVLEPMDLPAEITRDILSLLDPKDLRASLQVSRKWYHAVMESSVACKTMALKFEPSLMDLSKFLAFYDNAATLGKGDTMGRLELYFPKEERHVLQLLAGSGVDVSELYMMLSSEKTLLKMLRRNTKVRNFLKTPGMTVGLGFFQVESSRRLNRIMRYFKDVQSLALNLPEFPPDFDTWDGTERQKYTFLNLTKLVLCASPTNARISLANQHVLLEDLLYGNSFPEVTDLTLVRVPTRYFISLTLLTRRLKKLRLQSLPWLSILEAFEYLVGAGAQLDTLEVVDCHHKEQGEPDICDSEISLIHLLSQLRVLTLCNTSLGFKDIVKVIDSAEGGLEMLTLSIDVDEEGFSFASILEKCPNLRYLKFNGCTNFDDSTLRGLSRSLKMCYGTSIPLERLIFEHEDVTQEGIQLLLDQNRTFNPHFVSIVPGGSIDRSFGLQRYFLGQI